MKDGLWTIGDGASINALIDIWIYTTIGFRMETTPSGAPHLEIKLATLINSDRTWNDRVLCEVAEPQDVTCITKIAIPLSTNRTY